MMRIGNKLFDEQSRSRGMLYDTINHSREPRRVKSHAVEQTGRSSSSNRVQAGFDCSLLFPRRGDRQGRNERETRITNAEAFRVGGTPRNPTRTRASPGMLYIRARRPCTRRAEANTLEICNERRRVCAPEATLAEVHARTYGSNGE